MLLAAFHFTTGTTSDSPFVKEFVPSVSEARLRLILLRGPTIITVHTKKINVCTYFDEFLLIFHLNLHVCRKYIKVLFIYKDQIRHTFIVDDVIKALGFINVIHKVLSNVI